jgi:predicted dehydrogenase
MKTFGSAALGMSAASYSRVLGANDRIRVGLIGCGNRGLYLSQLFRKFPEVQISALCDVFQAKLRRVGEEFPHAVQLEDHRQLIARKDLDAVVIATPDHWHAEMAIDAMNSGKDVYVEKPLTFRREEGPAIIKAERTNQRICQVGLQRRSATLFRRAKQEIVDTGLLGKIILVRAVWHSGPPYDLGDPKEPQPKDLNWARFLGQVPWREWNPHQYHHYRLYLDFGGGSMTDLLTHWIDVAHMFLRHDSPLSVATVGGIFIADDDRTAPDTVNVTFEYPGCSVTFESAALGGMPSDHIVFCGTKGNLTLGRDRYRYRPSQPDARPIVVTTPETFVEEHIANFLECCRSRHQPNCDAQAGHRSALPCHLATLSYLQKRRIEFDPARELILS